MSNKIKVKQIADFVRSFRFLCLHMGESMYFIPINNWYRSLHDCVTHTPSEFNYILSTVFLFSSSVSKFPLDRDVI